MKNFTIAFTVQRGLCTGCGTCAALCPREAIQLTESKEKGLYIPVIDESLCNTCGVCYRACPGPGIDLQEFEREIFSAEAKDNRIGVFENCYLGQSTNRTIQYNGSSGGLITQILITCLDEGLITGALVTKMKSDRPLEPEPLIARTKEDLIIAAKSKYCPVPANIVLKEIMASGKEERFAVVGLPCHIHALRKAEALNKNLRKKIVLHLGIVCNHTPTFYATEYILKQLHIEKNDVRTLEYRGQGWPGGMTITTKQGDTRFIPHLSHAYWGGIFNCFFFPTRCMVCSDKMCRLSDGAFADAWVPDLMTKDSAGISSVVARSAAFDGILRKLEETGVIKLQKVDEKVIIDSQGMDQVNRRLNARITVMNAFGKKTPEPVPELPNARILDYIFTGTFFTRNWISPRKKLWFLIDMYRYLLEMGSTFKKRLSRR